MRGLGLALLALACLPGTGGTLQVAEAAAPKPKPPPRGRSCRGDVDSHGASWPGGDTGTRSRRRWKRWKRGGRR